MKIPFPEFEQFINETILKRGLQYFKKGHVNDPEEIEPGEYEAIVEGSEDYTVRIKIKNDVIIENVCTCPYDMGPVCKHVAALIFYLQQEQLNIKVKAEKGGTETKKPAQRKTVADQVNEILEKLSVEELKAIISERCSRDRNFRQLLMANYAHLIMPDSKSLYAKQIVAILKSLSGRHGFIEYSDSRVLGLLIESFVERAGSQVEQGNYKTALNIASAVLEEMTTALQFADDSNGDIGGCINQAIEVLDSVANSPIPEELRYELLQYCLNAFSKGLFKGWDWHFIMLDMACRLVKNADESKQIHTLLDTIKPSGKSWDWDFQKAQQIRALLIRKTEGEEEAARYMEQNITNADFRKEVIEKAISEKNYSKAIALAEDGIIYDSKESPGYLDYWYDYLLKVAILQNDRENIVKYAHQQFISANREKKYYFDLLKKHIAPGNWETFINQIIDEISKKDYWSGNSLIPRIYIWEEKWDELLKIVKQNVSLNNLESYEKYLIKDYAEEISGLYQIAILEYMENKVGRDHYQNACRYLRKMIKMGARDKADAVIVQLRTLYPKRKALMEELQKV
ncbi:MAG: hypothetical protein K0B15_14660 [Lentimicrobium sp.]|nr:hypothetical protein [Lentimicrobium sp.]